MPKQPKPKAPRLSKEQVAAQMAARAEADRFKIFIREKFYPILQTSGSIIEAQQFCEVLKTVIMSKCNSYWADKTIADLELVDEINKDAEAKDVEIYTSALQVLGELSITDAQKLLQGMGGALDGYTRREAEKVSLTDVPVEEIIVA